MKYTMSLREAPYNKIKSGIKTIELRLYDEKRQKLCIGDVIEFQCLEDPREKTLCKVIGLYNFPSFRELYDSLPLLKCGYTKENVKSASPEDMNKYYTPEKQRKYGVLGIEIEVF